MITSLRLKNFKNFANETLRMGPFTVIVGANASGKSNIRDAFRFLHGIGRGYRLAEIIGGKYGAGGQVEWEQIRGAVDEVIRMGKSSCSLGVTMQPFFTGTRKKSHYYNIRVKQKRDSSTFSVSGEKFTAGRSAVYTSHPAHGDPVRDQGDETHLLLRMAKTGDQRKYGNRISARHDQPGLTQIAEHKRVVQRQKAIVSSAINQLNDMRFLDLSPASLRKPAFPGQTILGDSGENLPTVLKEICENPKRRRALIEWTRELTPMDIRDFAFPTDQTTGHIQLAFKETSGKTVSAYSASDGTLRFLAMLAALLGKSPARLYVFEEIDNGIHPSRLRLLLDLIERQTAKGNIQVVTTTHSPDLLSMISNKTFEHTSVVCRNPDTDEAVIRPISELPNANKLKTSQGLGRLHTGGWLETAVWFSEGKAANKGNEE